ncbi:OmpA family protein [Variovorax sp. J22R133]|uniref:OmpA family protein n=1 Tax=Variovorax brevis TaxID=3053503 RepID=UPI002576A59F|nr:OmpA family protein [Variovorax sp. J22R133]MDM0111915.1 OmpA family protein [Variovorax sp. J22R133]
MAATSEDDGQTYFILGLAGGIIALVLFLVVGIAISRSPAPAAAAAGGAATATMAVAAAPKVVEVTETVVVVIPDGASVRVVDGVVKFYFATGSTDLAPGAAEALAAVIKGVEGGKKAVVSGYHDDTGDAAKNAELAKQRAERVQEVLVGLGVPAGKVELKKPEGTTGTGSNAEARRVEVKLVD